MEISQTAKGTEIQNLLSNRVFKKEVLRELNVQLAGAESIQSDYVVATFIRGQHPKTGESQWECEKITSGKTTKFITRGYFIDEGKAYLCRKTKALVTIKEFELWTVETCFPLSRKDEVEGEITKIEERLKELGYQLTDLEPETKDPRIATAIEGLFSEKTKQERKKGKEKRVPWTETKFG